MKQHIKRIVWQQCFKVTGNWCLGNVQKTYNSYLLMFIIQANLCKDEKSLLENELTRFEFGQRWFSFLKSLRKKPKYRTVRTDGRTGKHTDRQTDGRTDRQMDRQTDGPTDRHTDGRTKYPLHCTGRTDGRTDRQTERQRTDGRTDRRMNRQTEDGQNNSEGLTVGLD